MTDQEMVDLLTIAFQREADRSFVVVAGSTAPPLLPRLARECLRQMKWVYVNNWLHDVDTRFDEGYATHSRTEFRLAPPDWEP